MLAGKVTNDLLDIAIVGHSAAERINYIESLVIRADIDRKLLEYACLSFDKKKRRVIGLTKIRMQHFSLSERRTRKTTK